ncbi:hypothetical protein BJ912DRAFT_961688 [Pholiota molesta]|nr:hypothetical protein BJ912DRAFT_961688 [Pholiota molesta]
MAISCSHTARWKNHSYLSAVGHCFDIGNTISRTLAIYSKYAECVNEAQRANTSAGNGSLLRHRVLLIGLAYWRDDFRIKEYAKQSIIEVSSGRHDCDEEHSSTLLGSLWVAMFR